MLKFRATPIAVQDRAECVGFFKEMFGQNVILDCQQNPLCSLVPQSDFDRLAGLDEKDMRFGNNDMELYFETDDLDGSIELLDKHPEVERLHGMRTFPWMQRGIRIYDPDRHTIEISDSMYSVGCRLFNEGKALKRHLKSLNI